VLDGLSLLTADSHYKISTGTSVVTGSKACIHNAITNVFTVWFVAKQKWSPNFSPTDLAVAQGSWYHQLNRFRNSTCAAPQTSFGLEYAFFPMFFLWISSNPKEEISLRRSHYQFKFAASLSNGVNTNRNQQATCIFMS
jgi:hypothetical protein